MKRRALAAGLGLALAGCTGAAPGPRLEPTGADSSGPPLERTRWTLVQLEGEAVMSGEERREPHLILEPGAKRAAGSSGCNRFTGGYELDGESLRFGALASTKMACAQGMDQEQAFHSALTRTAHWRLSAGGLELLDAKGNELARFEARSAD